ncbi:TRAP transporter small permease [Bosea caraganae]|uniref:TRAP transporter small permease protein n=1 Tax=Bosea caraganae TaxID=2763117 RepID=A0A370L6U4_9HYPH|nr:TRAP transporter small permease subunit [Bosea caraganae]RDJ25475.1 TRAP transporter small permease [Bosea caraganae]RDJ25740.1 TRAP transporter small permease [Bosea caraganae]
MIPDLLKAADRGVAIICKYAAIACFLALFVLLGAAIILRLLPLFTIQGYDEIVELLFIWIVMLTSLALWREGALYRVMIFEDLLPHQAQRALEILINLAMLAFALILAFYGWEFMQMSGETTPFLRLDKGWWYAAIPLCGALMAFYSLVWLWRVIRGQAALESTATLIG